MIEIHGEHSVEESLINKGVCIDVGCRWFEFSKAMVDKGCKVLAYDVEEMQPPNGVEFKPCAVLNYNGVVSISFTDDKQATHISLVGNTVFCIDINSIYEEYDNIDVLKLDCEGSEYLILSDENFKPIPKQITVEFHAHAHKGLHEQYYQACMDNLLKYYVSVKHEWTSQHGAGFNYWDSLFIRKDLL
jgi:FkbM family methyltransferase